MLAAQPFQIDAERVAVDDAPSSTDHDPVGAMGATQDQSRDRIAGTGETKLIELIESEVGLAADGDATDIAASDTPGGALRRPAQRVEMRDLGGVIEKPAEHQGVTHTFHQVGIVVRGRAIDAETDESAGVFQFSGPAHA